MAAGQSPDPLGDLSAAPASPLAAMGVTSKETEGRR